MLSVLRATRTAFSVPLCSTLLARFPEKRASSHPRSSRHVKPGEHARTARARERPPLACVALRAITLCLSEKIRERTDSAPAACWKETRYGQIKTKANAKGWAPEREAAAADSAARERRKLVRFSRAGPRDVEESDTHCGSCGSERVDCLRARKLMGWVWAGVRWVLAVFLLGGVGIVVCFVAGIGGIWSTGLVIPYGGVWSHICLFVNLILRACYVLLNERRCVCEGSFFCVCFSSCIFTFVNGIGIYNF